MDYRTDHISGKPVRVMSNVWQCPVCNYTTNIVEDRRDHRLGHRSGILNDKGLMKWTGESLDEQR